MNKRENSKFFLLTLLGTLSAFGPFVTDMYLPALPSMSGYFATSSSMVQLGLSASVLGLAFGQLFVGPASDKFGRRPLLIGSMWLFLLSTLLCIFSGDIRQFLCWRFLQGVAGAGGIVLSRSIATDLFTGRELARTLAVIGAINAAAPVAAPILGGLFTDSLGWKGIFGILFLLGAALLAASLRFGESHPKNDALRLADSFKALRDVLRNKRCRYYILQIGFAHGVLFSYIASSPFIIQQHFGFSPVEFSFCFGFNALAIVLGAVTSVRFRHAQTATVAGCIGMVLFAAVEFAALALGCGFLLYDGLTLGLLWCTGITFVSSTTLAMESERRNAGAAAALLGAAGFAFGGVVSPLVGIGDMLLCSGILFVICAAGSLLCALSARRNTPHRQLRAGLRNR